MTNVLVVDDMRDVADSFAEVLSLCGYDVRVAYCGAQALSEADLRLPDVMLIDVNMPVMDGFQLAQRIRKRWGTGIRLVAHTACSREAVARKISEAGFDSFVSKSAQPLDLTLAIQGRRGRRDLRADVRDRRKSIRSGTSRRRSGGAVDDARCRVPSS